MTKKPHTYTVRCEAATWVVTCADGTIDQSDHPTKDDAVWFARRLARKNRPSRLVIYTQEGEREDFSYHQFPASWPR